MVSFNSCYFCASTHCLRSYVHATMDHQRRCWCFGTKHLDIDLSSQCHYKFDEFALNQSSPCHIRQSKTSGIVSFCIWVVDGKQRLSIVTRIFRHSSSVFHSIRTNMIRRGNNHGKEIATAVADKRKRTRATTKKSDSNVDNSNKSTMNDDKHEPNLVEKVKKSSLPIKVVKGIYKTE